MAPLYGVISSCHISKNVSGKKEDQIEVNDGVVLSGGVERKVHPYKISGDTLDEVTLKSVLAIISTSSCHEVYENGTTEFDYNRDMPKTIKRVISGLSKTLDSLK